MLFHLAESYAALSRLRKCGDMIPRSTKLMLVKTLIFPLFDYCCGLLLDLSKEHCVKLQRCMNAALRFALGLNRFEHITPAYSTHDLMKFIVRHDFMCVCLLYIVLFIYFFIFIHILLLLFYLFLYLHPRFMFLTIVTNNVYCDSVIFLFISLLDYTGPWVHSP